MVLFPSTRLCVTAVDYVKVTANPYDSELKIIEVQKGDKLVEEDIIRYKDIYCFEAYGDGTYIYTTKGVINSKNTLKYWFETVGQEHFYQMLQLCMYIKNLEV